MSLVTSLPYSGTSIENQQQQQNGVSPQSAAAVLSPPASSSSSPFHQQQQQFSSQQQYQQQQQQQQQQQSPHRATSPLYSATHSPHSSPPSSRPTSSTPIANPHQPLQHQQQQSHHPHPHSPTPQHPQQQAPVNHLFSEWMSRSETEQFLQQTLQTIHALDQSIAQSDVVRDTTQQQQQQLAAQSFAEAAAAVHMDDIATSMPHTSTITSSSNGRTETLQLSPIQQSRTISPFINITPPTGGFGSISASLSPITNSPTNPRSPSGPRSPGGGSLSRVLVNLSPNPHPLDPLHLQVDEVSLKASPTNGLRRITPIDAVLGHSPGASPSPPGSPLASPNSMHKRKLNKPLNLPSSPRLTSPSPPRSPARHITTSPQPSTRTQQRIPQFFFPDGSPPSPTTKRREHELIHQLWSKRDGVNGAIPSATATAGASESYANLLPSSAAGGTTSPTGTNSNNTSMNMDKTIDEFFPFTTLVCGFSSYCNSALFEKLLVFQQEMRLKPGISLQQQQQQQQQQNGVADDQPRVSLETFLAFHAQEIEKFDLPTRFFRLLRSNEPAATSNGLTTPNASSAASTPSSSTSSSSTGTPRRYLTRDDFKTIVQEIVNRHPGLEFLESTPEFQLKYAQTVIARIFYQVNQSGNEKLTLRELKNCNFLLMLALLDQEDDINKLNDYFSYEHFYVIYCKFWELDEDHDGYIDGRDLLQYDDYALTRKVVDRIMSGAGRKLLSPIPYKMNYLDFVIFLISEVDKNNDVSLDYFFNVIDLDGDGIISTYEIEIFFEEQKQRIQSLSQELITFPDILCQLIDMVQKALPQYNGGGMKKMNGSGNMNDGGSNSSGSSNTGSHLRLKQKRSYGSNSSTSLLYNNSYSGSGSGSGGSGGSGSGSSSSTGGNSFGVGQLLPPSSFSNWGNIFNVNSNNNMNTNTDSRSHSTTTSTSLVAPLFHSHHKPYHSTASHTPVQGGSIYNVSEGIFYKKDLRDSKMASQFFATLFNLNKFVQSEQRDPIRIKQIHDTPQLTDWDRYAISGYYRLAGQEEEYPAMDVQWPEQTQDTPIPEV